MTVGMVWSQEAGACAGSVRYPPSWVTTKNDLLVRVENSQIAVRTVESVSAAGSVLKKRKGH